MPNIESLGKVESVIIGQMIFPDKVPGLKWLTILTAVYGVVWMGLEGDLRRVTVMGTAVSFVAVGHIGQRLLAGRHFQLVGWQAMAALVGLLAGLGSGLLTLFFMAIKTGLHGHGPEFRPSEIEGVLGMLPLWGVVGLVTGLGVGLLVWELRKRG